MDNASFIVSSLIVKSGSPIMLIYKTIFILSMKTINKDMNKAWQQLQFNQIDKLMA